MVLQNDEFMHKQNIGWSIGVIKYNNDKAIQQYEHNEVDFTRGAKAVQFLNHATNVPWLQKDPRMCITLPTWLHLLNMKPAIVFTYRHPLEVAMSLQKREKKFALERALRLWIVYNMRAIQNSQGLCRVFTSNNAILENPLEEVQRIVHELTNKCGVAAPPRHIRQEIVHEFVDPELQQQKMKQEEQNTEQNLLMDMDGCKVYDFKSANESGARRDREMNMYKKAMTIYCHLESGKAYEEKYEWPKL